VTSSRGSRFPLPPSKEREKGKPARTRRFSTLLHDGTVKCTAPVLHIHPRCWLLLLLVCWLAGWLTACCWLRAVCLLPGASSCCCCYCCSCSCSCLVLPARRMRAALHRACAVCCCAELYGQGNGQAAGGGRRGGGAARRSDPLQTTSVGRTVHVVVVYVRAAGARMRASERCRVAARQARR